MEQTVTLIPGDGIGPDLTDSVKEVIGALDVGIEWEIAEAGEAVMDREGTPLPDSVLESIRRNKVAIKGPLTTPVGTGFRSVNVALRKELDLYGNIRPSLSLPGVETPYQNIDIIIYRENTEDRSEEHTSELQSRQYLVCRLLLEKKTNYFHVQSTAHF